MNDLKQTYIAKKSIIDAIADFDHPLHKELAKSITIEQFETIYAEVKEMEDQGVHLIAKRIN